MAVPVVTTPVAEAGLAQPRRRSATHRRRVGPGAHRGLHGPPARRGGWTAPAPIWRPGVQVSKRFRWDAIGSQLDEILRTTRRA